MADEKGRARGPSFSDLLDLLDEMEHYIQPAGLARQSLSILIGRPLALVRASLQLELDGPPATDLGWSQSGRSNPPGFTRVKFPIRLGDMRKGRDGLIGYFVGDDYQTIRLSHGTPRAEGQENGYFEYDADIPLTCYPGAKPIMVTLLMDPQTGMHIRSGILPLKYIELPPYGVSDALSAMDITFLTAPVIAGPETPSIPLPSDIHGEWLWISPAKDGKVNEARAIGKGQERTPSLFGPIHIHEGWLKLHSDLKGAPDRAKDDKSGNS
jgi:hypothetical protein